MVEQLAQDLEPRGGAVSPKTGSLLDHRHVLTAAEYRLLCYDHQQPPVLSCAYYTTDSVLNISQPSFHLISKAT